MKYLLLLLFITSFSAANAQVELGIATDMKVYNEAYAAEDFDTYLKYTIQSVIQLGGGDKLMKEAYQENKKTADASGIKVLSIEPSWMSPHYESDGATHVVVGQQKVMEVQGQKFVQMVYYLAETIDGQSWMFVSLEAYTKESLSLYIPGLSPELEIPAVDNPLPIRE